MITGYYRPVGHTQGGNVLYAALACMIWFELGHACPSAADHVRVSYTSELIIEITARDFFTGKLASFVADVAWVDQLMQTP